MMKHMPSCMNADDIEQLLQEIPVHQPAAVPVRTVQEAVAAGDLPPLDVDA
jgi:site-specific recombinase XerC